MKHFFQSALLLLALLLPATAMAHDFEVNGIYYSINGNNATVTFGGENPWNHNSYSGDVTIPATVTYNGTTYSVTSIGAGAFRDCSGLTSIDIPNSVTSISDEAFTNCSGLTSINIPNSVTAIEPQAFWNCSGLTRITVASGNTKYDSRNGCNAIIETASNTLITGCQNTIIPNSVTAIGDGAFSSCSGLTSINIPNSVTSIGSSAFWGCSGLTSIEIPNSVTSIGDCAFYCYSLKDIYSFILNPLNKCHMGAFEGINVPNTLHVPLGTFEAYQNCKDWSHQFNEIVEMDTVASSIILDRSNAVMLDYDSLQLTAIVEPFYLIYKSFVWASNNPAVATVDENGLVTAHSVGTATITASTTDGSNLSASCVVTVKSLSADNAFAMPDSEVLHGEAVVIPFKMNNSEEIMAFQTDIYLPEGFTIMADENNEIMVMPSTRLTSDHMLMTERLADGAVRVLCYTPSAQAIEGNEGDLFYITVATPGDAAGDYAIYLRNSRLTNSDYEELRLPDTGAVLTVKTFIPGDANDSHAVNVADIVTTAQYVMQRNPSPFVFEAADMNGDGEVSVTDIMLIARLILYPTMTSPKHAPAIVANGDRMSGKGITLMPGETRRVSIDLDNEADYSAFQLDLTLPTGMMASNFMLTDRDGNHALDVETLNNGKVRVLCYSPAIEAIKGNSGAVLTLDVKATGNVNGCIGVDGIELVTADCQTVRPGTFTIAVNNVTAVDEVAAGKTVTGIDYYNLAGQRVSEPASGVTLVVTTYSDGTRTTAKVIR